MTGLNTIWKALLATATLAAAVDSNYTKPFPGQKAMNGSFVTPPNGITAPSDYPTNPTFKKGQTLNITWNSDLKVMDLCLCQPWTNGQFVYQNLSLQNTDKSYSWVVSNPQIWTDVVPNVYFLLVNDANDWNTYFTSHFFNVTDDDDTSSAAPTTATGGIGVINPTATSLGMLSATATPAAGGSGSGSSANTNSSTNNKHSISGGAVAGIVIGSIAGVALIAAAAWFIVRYLRSQKAGPGASIAPMPPAAMDAAKGVAAGPKPPLPSQGHYGPSEMAANGAPWGASSELPAHSGPAMAELPAHYESGAVHEVEAEPVMRR